MSSFIGSAVLIQNYIRDCRSKHVEVMLPHILRSGLEFVVYKGALFYPLSGIVGVGPTIVQQIIEDRSKKEFASFDDFIFRTTTFLNKKTVVALIHAGTLDCFGLPRKQMVESYEETKDKKIYSQVLGNKLIQTEKQYDEYRFDEISRLEKEALGFNLKYNMFTQYAWLYEKESLKRLNEIQVGMRVRFLFVLTRVKEIQTKKQETMAFLELVDDTMKLDGVAFPKTYLEIKDKLVGSQAYIGVGKAEEREGRIQIIFENVYSVM